jgi:hypothetical protein
VEFSQEETALLLQGVTLDQLPPATAKKLEQSDMVELLDVFPRNLDVFLKSVKSLPTNRYHGFSQDDDTTQVHKNGGI